MIQSELKLLRRAVQRTIAATRYDKAPCANRRLRHSKIFNGENRENLVKDLIQG